MTDSLLDSFVAEARELLRDTAAALLVLEKHHENEAAINDVFRSVHTLKGSVGLFDFPAFSKLIHAAEDVLSAVRDGQLEFTSILVDMLLDSLDQVSAWVDGVATTGCLPTDADAVSRALTAGLRAVLPAGYGAPKVDAFADRTGDLTTLEWLAGIPEPDRLAAFTAALRGAELIAIEYGPDPDCFFSGEDPLGLFRQLPALHSLTLEPTEPWGTPDTHDPYRCVLRFRALTLGPRNDVESLFRYVIEQVRTAGVPPHVLVSLSGVCTGEPADAAFIARSRALVETADWSALRRLADAALLCASPSSLDASALRWLLAVLSAPAPDPMWAAALIDCIVNADFDVRLSFSGSSDADRPAPARTGIAGGKNISPLATRILHSQSVILRLPPPIDGIPTLDSVARTVSNLLAAQTTTDSRRTDWASALEAARAQGNARPVLTLLDQWLAVDEPPATAMQMDQNSAAPAAVEPPSRDTKPASRVLKVDPDKIDTLMNLIGELVVSKNSMPFLARRAEHVHGSRAMGREIKDLHAVVDRLAQEMQNAIMAVRMLPVSDVFDRFPRLVRDVSRKLGKQIDLVIEGADTAADKNIIEALGDPLLHIVRNAIDHGIELPEDRDDMGKPTPATVLLRAFQESDQVVIEVVDDGRGIDPETIKRSALSKGIIDADRAMHLTDQEAVNLVFTPGFSTVVQVTDLSGRGVGMDVVMNGVSKAGGSVAITSVKDAGTTVRLALPLSLAVTRVMVVEAGGGMLFGIPMDQIAETVRVHRDNVRNLKHSEAFVLRDAVVPLIRLDRLLGIEPATWIGDGNEEDAVLVVRSHADLAGLVVDRFHEGMDIILKPFDEILANLGGYSGSALLGDGRVLLILNLRELL